MQKILVVEDDWELNQGICYALQSEGYVVESVHSLKGAKDTCSAKTIDLVLLDVNLPDGEGFSFCEWLPEQKKCQILFLTARDLEEDALRGYELGAADYVTKPFSMKVLLKKISVILKREKTSEKTIFDDGFLYINFDMVKVMAHGKDCMITPTEFRLLKFLFIHPQQVLTYSVLLEHIWDNGGQFVDKHALAVNVNRLRGKIEDEQHKYIVNIYGMGYQWLG